MLALALALTLSAAPPRGFVAAHSAELITEVDKRLPKWLTHEGDWKVMLATEKELETYFAALGVKKENSKSMIAATIAEQNDKPALKEFAASRVLIEFDHKSSVTLHFFDDANRCQVPLANIGTEAKPRYVLLGGPLTDKRTIESVLEKGRSSESMLVFAEKKDGAWTTGSLPAPKPPDCTAAIKKALSTIATSEKAYFAEHDAFTNSLTKLGVEAKSLGISSVKITVAGNAPQQTYVIQIGHKGGLMTMNEKAEIITIAPCPE